MCDVVDKVNLVLDCVKDREHTVKTIVLMETPSADLVNRGQQAGIHILSLQEMEVSRQLLSPPVCLLFLNRFLCFFSPFHSAVFSLEIFSIVVSSTILLSSPVFGHF